MFVPDRFIVKDESFMGISGETPGSGAHGNPLFAGAFEAFAVGEIAAITVGLGYAALDEYRRILTATKAPTPEGMVRANAERRIDGHNWQRSYGLAQAMVDSAAAISTQTGRLYDATSRGSAQGVEPFSRENTYRLRKPT